MGVESVIKELAPGDIVGEFCLYSGKNKLRSASVRVPHDAKSLLTLEFSIDDLKWLGPPYADQVLQSIRNQGQSRRKSIF